MSLKTPKENTEIIAAIQAIYGGKVIELDYETPFQLLCAVMLSAQTTDKQVNRITPFFFAKVREAKDLWDIELSEVEHFFRNVNFFRNKAKHVKLTGERLAREFNGIIPNDLAILQTFPGIGIKTAKVVLSVLYEAPYVGVDTHIHRVTNRIGMVRTKTPEETDRAIVERLTLEQRIGMHHPFVLFGRYHCTARKPQCLTCPVQKWCEYFKKLPTE